MKHINLLHEVLKEGVYNAIVLNLFKAMQSSCFLAHSKHACNFQRHEVLFVNYTINALPLNYLSFINKANNIADYFLKNVTVS
jgi:DNA-binding sugar fermentation-stimulating protein